MQILSKLTIAALMCAGLSVPALAAGESSQTSAQGQSAPGATPAKNPASMRVGQELRGDLSRAGFTDITVMPESFLVRAKDSHGNPVMMVINPDSVAEVTEQKVGGGSASAAQRPVSKGESGAKSFTPANGSGAGASSQKP